MQVRTKTWSLHSQLHKQQIDNSVTNVGKTQCLLNIWMDEYSHSQDGPSFCNCRIWWPILMGVWPGKSLSCLHYTYNRPWSMITALLRSDFSGFTLVPCWKQQLRDIRVNYWQGSASISITWDLAQQVKGDKTEYTHSEQLQGMNAKFFSPWQCSNSTHLMIQIRITAKIPICRPLLQQPGRRLWRWQGSDNHSTKGTPHSLSRAGFDQHNTNQSPCQGDNGTSLWTKLTHQGRGCGGRGRSDTRNKRSYHSEACWKEATTTKISQNEMTKKYVEDKGIR